MVKQQPRDPLYTLNGEMVREPRYFGPLHGLYVKETTRDADGVLVVHISRDKQPK